MNTTYYYVVVQDRDRQRDCEELYVPPAFSGKKSGRRTEPVGRPGICAISIHAFGGAEGGSILYYIVRYQSQCGPARERRSSPCALSPCPCLPHMRACLHK